MAEWVFWAFGSACFAALTAILAKMGVAGISSNIATLIRTAVVLVVVALLVGVRREWAHSGQLTLRSTGWLALSGLTTGLSWLCYYRALQQGPASLVVPLDKLSIVMAVGLAAWVFGERLTGWQWGGVGLVTAGIVLLVAHP